MELEQQVVSLDLAKRLKELGVRQESYFKYCASIEAINAGVPKLRPSWQFDHIHSCTCYYREHYSAFTVAELGEMLPKVIEKKVGTSEDHYMTFNHNSDDLWVINYKDWRGYAKFTEFDKNEADARAKMLIHLIEKGIVKL